MRAGDLAPVGGGDTGLLEQLAPGAVERALARRDAALGDLPRVVVEGVAVLADEQDPVVVVDRQDAGREVREMDDAVDPGRAVRAGHLVVPDGDPRVLVGDTTRSAGPRPVRDRRLIVHPGIVARGGRSRPRVRARP